jgi:hypothetical protein
VREKEGHRGGGGGEQKGRSDGHARIEPGGGRSGRKGHGCNRKAFSDGAPGGVNPDVGVEKLGGVEVDRESENSVRPASLKEDCDECLVCLSPEETWKPFKTLTCCSCRIHVDCLEDWEEKCDKQKFPKTCPQGQRQWPEVSDDSAVAEGLFMSKFGRLDLLQKGSLCPNSAV